MMDYEERLTLSKADKAAIRTTVSYLKKPLYDGEMASHTFADGRRVNLTLRKTILPFVQRIQVGSTFSKDTQVYRLGMPLRRF